MDIPAQLFIAILGGLVVALIEQYIIRSNSESQTQFQPITVHATPVVVTQVSSGVECANAKCGSKNRTENRRCTTCGDPLYERCPNCSHSKPVIDKRCGNCGKDPKELRRMKHAMRRLYTKARWLGLAYVFVLLRTLSLSSKWELIDVLSGIVVVLGVIGLSREAISEFSWLRGSGIWHYRFIWLSTTSQDIERSYKIFTSIILSASVLAAVLLYRIAEWWFI